MDRIYAGSGHVGGRNMRLMLSVASYILMLLSGGVASLGLGIGNIYYLIAGSIGVVVFAALKKTASL